MPLTMPQPDLEPCLAFPLGAFRFPKEVEAAPHRIVQATGATSPDDEDEDADPVGSGRKFRACQLLMVYGERR